MLMRVCLGPGIKMNMTIQGAHSVARQSAAAGKREREGEGEGGGHRLIATAEFQCFTLISGGPSVTQADPSSHHEASFCEY